MKYILLIFFTLTVSVSVSAEAVFYTLDTKVKESAFIVVGVLDNVKVREEQIKLAGEEEIVEVSTGRIKVESVLKGNSEKSEITITWKNLKGVICPYNAAGDHAKKKGIWIINFEGGKYSPVYQESFLALKEKHKVLEEIKKHSSSKK